VTICRAYYVENIEPEATYNKPYKPTVIRNAFLKHRPTSFSYCGSPVNQNLKVHGFTP